MNNEEFIKNAVNIGIRICTFLVKVIVCTIGFLLAVAMIFIELIR